MDGKCKQKPESFYLHAYNFVYTKKSEGNLTEMCEQQCQHMFLKTKFYMVAELYKILSEFLIHPVQFRK